MIIYDESKSHKFLIWPILEARAENLQKILFYFLGNGAATILPNIFSRLMLQTCLQWIGDFFQP